MEVNITKKGDENVVELVGRLDTPSAQEVSKALTPLQDKASETIVLDCSKLSYISSSGLRIFLGLRKAAAVKGGKVIVRKIGQEIRNVFMITGFLNLFDIED